jgi:short-subunit dehydrogenase
MTAPTSKTAIVTGASSGIGKATAEALADAGYRVFGTSRRAEGSGPRGVHMLACDVTEMGSVSALVAAVLAKTGRIDLVVNNAGVGLVGAAEESSVAQVQRLFDVNVFGVLRVTNAVLPIMRQQGGGRIITMSSALGLVPAPYSAHYAAGKHAIEAYSESLDHEVRAFGIRVTLIEPAFVQGSFDQNSLVPDSQLKDYEPVLADVHAFIADVTPTADTPQMVAEVVLRAATATVPKRRYTVGQNARQISLLRRYLPAGLFDRLLRWQFRLPA